MKRLNVVVYAMVAFASIAFAGLQPAVSAEHEIGTVVAVAGVEALVPDLAAAVAEDSGR